MSKGILLAGGWAAVAGALYATSGLATPGAAQIVLASGAIVALALASATRRS